MPMQAPVISGAPASKPQSIEQLSQATKQSVEVGEAFSEVLDLVKPREAPQVSDTPANERADLKEASNPDHDGRAELNAREEQGVERGSTSEDSKQVKDASANAHVERTANQEVSEDERTARADALKVIQQLSQEDLLKLIELSEAQNASVTPELTAFEAEALPAIQALSSHELMALLHGFQDAQQPQLQALQTELTGQALLQEQALTQGLSQQQLTQGLNLQVTQQVTQPQVTPNAIMPLMEAVVRPQEVMPALNQVKLNASQREGIIRQIAHSFRTRGGGTQTTEIRLNPEELGLVKLKVEMRGTDVRVFFAAENPAVMDLLSENIDQLKAMLTEQEFNLTEAGVWQEFNSQGDGRGEEGDEDYGSDERPDLRHRPKSARSMSPLPGRFRATI